ncbi:phage capsid protein [Aminipila butyrica]|uniref:Phage capsid protein n=1 Tax=Aminipila butyrica TaxID=433296 RepID=A0A858BT47_9FIRM|nr:phage minor capsid protein [Aminipila butyrica]QIB68258.1 phage capsid protein [Aminipila butyrica]
MLKPRYLEQLPDNLLEIYSQAERDIIVDMVRRITTYDFFIPSAEYQLKKLQDMGLLHNEIIRLLSKSSGIAEKEIKRLMKEAGATALKTDDSIYRKAGLDPTPLDANPALQAVMASGIKKTGGLFKNLTNTTANTATKQFERALDRAYMQITSGAFDYNSAIRMVIKDLCSKGVAVIEYPSGHVDYMEVAVRRATVTGVNQTAAKLQDTRADEMGSDLVETTAHAGARPEHTAWQGKIFSRGGKHSKYPDFVTSTGYGTGTGLCGWNCRHNFFPYFKGISKPAYSKAGLKDMDAKKYTYNSQELTEYEATQKQRTIERAIRKWKREEVAMKAADQPTDEATSKVRQWQGVQRDFINQTGLKRQYDREQVGK